MRTEFGQYLEQHWLQHGYKSQAVFAAKIGYPQSYLSRVIRGEKPASAALLAKIATELNLDFEDLMRRAGLDLPERTGDPIELLLLHPTLPAWAKKAIQTIYEAGISETNS